MAVTPSPTNATEVIAVPTIADSSLIISPLIAVPPLAVFAALQDQPPEPFAVRTKLSVPVPPLESCICVGFILPTLNKSVVAL